MFESRVTDMMTSFRNRVFSEGEAVGEARGRAEGEITGAMKKALEIARNLLGIGTSADAVARATGLPLADVERLAAEMR